MPGRPVDRWVRLVGLEVLAVGVPIAFVLLAAPGPFAWSVTAALVGCALLPLRHLWAPLGIIGSFWAIAGGLGWASEIVALFGMGRRTGSVWRSLPWLVLSLVAAVVPVLLTQDLTWRAIILTLVFAGLSAGSPLAVGLLVALRDRLTTSVRELEEAREATVRARESAARAEERSRIGREIHDAVGHHATLIAVGAAALSASTTEPGTREAAERLRMHAKRALAEMRTALGLAGADTAEQAGTAQLAGLVDRSVAGGMAVRLVPSGEPRPLTVSLDRAVYRIVQESLTNAARHSPGAAVEVEVDWREPVGLRVEVRNGPARRAVAPRGAFGIGGAGLAGLVERVRSVGGDLRTGPAAGGGFAVVARLPVAGRPPRAPEQQAAQQQQQAGQQQVTQPEVTQAQVTQAQVTRSQMTQPQAVRDAEPRTGTGPIPLAPT
ncbi:MAG: histidine kinase [Pseudonocardia sp.]|nr:histidine kinase [Pseudonocardia sp.]